MSLAAAVGLACSAAPAAEPWPPANVAPAASAASTASSAPASAVGLDLDHSLDAPPPPPRIAAKILLGTGGALILGGFVGTVVTPHCATEDARGGCVDPQGSAGIFPVMMAVGIAVSVVGGYFWRQDAPATGGP